MTTEREKYHQQLHNLAQDAFKDHQISKKLSDRHWLIQRPYEDGYPGWDGTFATEIVVLHTGKIVVAGDIGPMIFGYYSRAKDSPEGAIHWLGRQNCVDSYIVEKAAIGCGEEVKEWEEATAADDLDHLYKECEDDETSEVIADARLAVVDGKHEVYSVLWSGCPNYAMDVCGWIGMVPKSSVYYAWAAIAKLSKLLEK